tara:strand:- start:27421 stop:27744 length:324 start_codon:yes stop_codon:yes gene_type:complete
MSLSKDEIAKRIKLLMTFNDGEDIEYRGISREKWSAVIGAQPEFFFREAFEFRKKPEPEIIWVNKTTEGGYSTFVCRHDANLNGNLYRSPNGYKYIAKKFIAADEGQ